MHHGLRRNGDGAGVALAPARVADRREPGDLDPGAGDPPRGGEWFVMVFATFGFSQFLLGIPARHGRYLYGAVVPVILVMNYLFWLITPRLLLDKHLDRSDLRPGAVMGMIGSTALWRL